MNIEKQDHHSQQELCVTRPCYRDGKKPTAVKVRTKYPKCFLEGSDIYLSGLNGATMVYTVCDESTHLLVSRVPSINLHTEVCTLCNRFGKVTNCTLIPGYQDKETYEDTFHVQYSRIQAARYAKKCLDGREFFGGMLHVCYTPELESVDETRSKLVQRRKEIAFRTKRKTTSTDRPVDVPSKTPSRNSIHPPVEGVNCNNYEPVGCNTNTENHSQNLTMSSTGSEVSNLPNFSQYVANQSTSKVPGRRSNKLSMNRQYEKHSPSSSQAPSLLRFVPRSVVIKKRIVFHNKQNPP